MEGKNIVAVSVKDYKNLYEKNELRVLKDYTIFLIRGEGQKAPEEGEFEDIVVTDCNDGQCIRSAIKDHLDTEDIGNHFLVFYGKNLPQINAAPIDGYQIMFCPKDNLKRAVDQFTSKLNLSKTQKQQSKQKKQKTSQVSGDNVSSENTQNKNTVGTSDTKRKSTPSKQMGTSIATGRKIEEEPPKSLAAGDAEENKQIMSRVSAEKAKLISAVRQRLAFHIKLCIGVELNRKELFSLIKIVAGIPLDNNSKEGECTKEKERELVFSSWNAIQGNPALSKITFDDYAAIKKEIIYYYNLAIFLYEEDRFEHL